MSNERTGAQACSMASLARNGAGAEALEAHGAYVVECVGPDGGVRWVDHIDNLVVTQGRNDALDKYLAGSAYTASWFLGLISAAGYSAIVAGDTAASHAGWTEFVGYSQGTRPEPAFGAASAGSKATSGAVGFSVNGSGTVKGCFLISDSAKSGTAGVLYSAGLFSGGDRAVENGDTLNVSYTASLTAS